MDKCELCFLLIWTLRLLIFLWVGIAAAIGAFLLKKRTRKRVQEEQ